MIKKIASLSIALIIAIMAKTVNASTSSIMIDAKNGEVMYERNADVRRYPASLTKLMTLYITFNALENNHIKLNDKLKVSRTAANRSPSRLGLRPGSTITVKDAIMAVIVKSANDCATVLAEHFSPTEADFAVLMTSTAKKLGMNDTTFKNASGLPNSKQKTTARDMATLAMAVYHHFPQYYSWFSAKSFTYKGQKIYGHNNLLKTFEGADGMKTGYTAASGYNIVTSAKRNQNRVIAVTMGHNCVDARDKKVAIMMDKGLEHLKSDGDEINIAELRAEINQGRNRSRRYARTKRHSVKYAKRPIPTRRPTYYAKADTKVISSKIAAKNNNIAKKSSEPTSMPVQEYASANNGSYAVQVGSFTDYQRAKNYALSVKNKLAKHYPVYNIKVEKVQTEDKVVYRSKVIGLAKNAASRICRNMKNHHHSCLVVAENGALKLAQR